MPLTQDAAAIAAHYAILRIGRSATSHDAMKAYKKAIRGTHPDKGGDEEKAKALNNAKDYFEELFDGNTTKVNSGSKGKARGTGKAKGHSKAKGKSKGKGKRKGKGKKKNGDEDDSDGTFVPSEGDNDSTYGSGREEEAGEDNAPGWAFGNNYGNLNDLNDLYVVLMEDGRKVSIRTHKRICGCNLEDLHCIAGRKSDNDESVHANDGHADNPNLVGGKNNNGEEYDSMYESGGD